MKISILGDSISTYEGYNPIGYSVFYDYERTNEYGLTNVNNTWWMKVINALNGELCINNSFAGSTVYKFSEYSISAKERCQALHTQDDEPDVILVYAGTNDCLAKMPINDFYNAYDKMLKRIKERYKNAKIFSATLAMGDLKEGAMLADTYFNLEAYSNVIKKVCVANDVEVVDLLKHKTFYSANDYRHPNKEGHELISKWWIEELKKHIEL